jgi:hypothetical protein
MTETPPILPKSLGQLVHERAEVRKAYAIAANLLRLLDMGAAVQVEGSIWARDSNGNPIANDRLKAIVQGFARARAAIDLQVAMGLLREQHAALNEAIIIAAAKSVSDPL